jgi:hypothetical protein
MYVRVRVRVRVSLHREAKCYAFHLCELHEMVISRSRNLAHGYLFRNAGNVCCKLVITHWSTNFNSHQLADETTPATSGSGSAWPPAAPRGSAALLGLQLLRAAPRPRMRALFQLTNHPKPSSLDHLLYLGVRYLGTSELPIHPQSHKI